MGTRRVAVILVNFQDDTRKPWTPAEVRSMVFTGADSANAFWRESSNQRLALSGRDRGDGDVLGWFTLGNNRGNKCRLETWGANAEAKARAKGHDLSNYEHIVVVWPRAPGCGDVLGAATVKGDRAWINGKPDTQVVAHELGHNFGAAHASGLSCLDLASQAGCKQLEYADPYDIMGNVSVRHPSVTQGLATGMLSRENVPKVNSGVYPILANEGFFPRVPMGLQLLRWTTPGVGFYAYDLFLELRRPFGQFDNFSPTDPVVNGLTLRFGNKSEADWPFVDSLLLDPAPGAGDASLRQGQTFVDLPGEVAVKPLSITSQGATVQVQHIPTVSVQGSEIVFRAQLSQVNKVSVNMARPVPFYIFKDTGTLGLKAGPGCSQTGDVQQVICPLTPSIKSLKVETQDLDDTVVLGTGFSTVAQSADGGAGNDVLVSDGSSDVLIGGHGEDILTDGLFGGGGGNDRLVGGSGPDVMLGGPGAFDTVDYSDHNGSTSTTTVDLEGDRDDGSPGEGDQVGADVENILGGNSRNVFTGNEFANWLIGGNAVDVLRGGGGPDVISGGGSADQLFGEAGADLVLSRDGIADTTVSCGIDSDSFDADAFDPVGSDCRP